MRHILIAAALVTGFLSAAEVVDENANWKIRREATEHSAIMHTLHMLTDRYGPRLTGSPNYEAAAKWAVSELSDWGLKNAHLEPWKFGHPGWLNERAAGYLVDPVKDNLTFEVLAWTPSTNGTVTGSVVQLVPPDKPSKEELTSWLEANKDKVRGKVVLMGKAAVVRISFNPANKRIDDADMRARLDPVNPTPMFPNRGGQQNSPGKLTTNEAEQMLNAWLAENGALLRMNDAGRENGQIRAFNNRTFDVTKAVPTVVLRNEDFGRIERLLADNLDVRVQFDIVNRTYPEGDTSYNVVAEIPGSDKASEVVMLGGHLDSWHSATGATDNAIGCATMMEAARIIRALGLKPRRTIRLALWSGEEQGLLGSKEYVKQHFGTFEDPKSEYGTLVAYFNIDSGTGRARGASVFGPSEAADVVRAALAPFEDLGVLGAIPSRSRTPGGTDSTSFNAAGLTGIGMMQDPIEYQSHTWHTNLDTYERIIPEDATKSSIAIAAAIWHVANRDEALPRFSKEKMPEPPKPEGAKPEAPKPEATK
jgi:hypothetical protein